MRGAGTSYAKTGGTLRTGSGRVKLRDRRNAKSERRTRTVAPRSLLLHHPLRDRAKLRHLRQGTISSREVTPSLEDVPRRSPTSNSHPHRPLEPPVLEGASKNQSTNRARIPRTARVQFHTQACGRKQKRTSRRPLPKTRLRHRRGRQRQRHGTTSRSIRQTGRK